MAPPVKKVAAPKSRELVLVYDPPKQRFRFLFSDGQTVDVLAVRDDSDLRAWVLDLHFGAGHHKDEGKKIEGVARLEQ